MILYKNHNVYIENQSTNYLIVIAKSGMMLRKIQKVPEGVAQQKELGHQGDSGLIPPTNKSPSP